MNLRILKKLSKRAAPLLPELGDRREQFRAGTHENYISTLVPDRKHWDRSPCHPSYVPRNDYSRRQGMALKVQTRAGNWIVVRPPWNARKGTIMLGGMDGGETPEWSEESAWEALQNYVFVHFTDWSQERPVALRDLSTVTKVFEAAAEILAEPR